MANTVAKVMTLLLSLREEQTDQQQQRVTCVFNSFWYFSFIIVSELTIWRLEALCRCSQLVRAGGTCHLCWFTVVWLGPRLLWS